MLVVDLTHSEIKCIFSEILFVLGGIEECKKKWASVRDQLRRTLLKRKTTSGQTAVWNRKYKYEHILAFLTPHIAERGTHSPMCQFQKTIRRKMTK